MSRDKATDAAIRKFSPKTGEFRVKMVGTGATKGLGIRIRKNGAVAWIFSFRTASKQTTIQLGHYPQMGRAQAEAETLRLRALVVAGVDPRIEARLGGSVSAERLTLAELVARWLERRPASVRQTITGQFERYVFPAAGAMPADALTASQVLSILNEIHVGTPSRRPAPSIAAKILGHFKSAYAYGRALRLVTSRECDDLTARLLGLRQESRERVLTDSELADVLRWTISGKAPAYYRNAARLILLFGCRTIETRLSTPGEWDMDAGIWLVPAAHSKNNLEIARPITDAARPFLAELLRKHAGSDYLLGEERKQATVSRYLSEVWQRLGHATPWTAHDLRRTARTRFGDLGIDDDVGEALLGHKRQGVHGIYNRSQVLQQKAAALEAWHREIARIERAGILKTVKEATFNE